MPNEFSSPVVTCASVEAFVRDGIICLNAAVDAIWTSRLQAACNEATSEAVGHSRRHGGENGGPAFFTEVDIYRRHPVFREFECFGPLRQIAAELMRSEKINLFGDQLLVKEPGSSAPTPWHHDLPYWALKGSKILSCWIALDDVDRSNGAVEYVRGSHRGEELFRPQEFGAAKRFEGMQLRQVPDINAHRSEYDIVSFTMKPGDVLVFHARTLHGSPPNDSPRVRRALSVRYTGDDVVYQYIPGMPPPSIPLTKTFAAGDALDSADFPVVWRSADRVFTRTQV